MTAVAIYTTYPSRTEAQSIATQLVEAKLAGCCNIYDGVESIYIWEGKICQDKETILIIKTLEDKFPAIEKLISENHSYSTPCIAMLKIDKLNKVYLDWLTNLPSTTL